MRNLFKPTSYRQGAVLAVGATALWKILSFANALLIAAWFGAGSGTDLYFYILIALGLGTYFLQRMNVAVVIPEAMNLASISPRLGQALLNGFLYLYVGLLAVSVGIALCCPVTLAKYVSRFQPAELAAQQPLLVWGIILFGLQVLAGYLTAVLEMYRRFTSALFAPLNALLPLVCLLLLAGRCGIVSLLYGFVLSNVIQIIVFVWVLKKELHWQFAPFLLWHSRVFRHNLLSNQFMELINIINGLLPLYLLSGLAAGLVSALNYAKQFSDSANEVFSLRVTNISKIELTEYAAFSHQHSFNVSYLHTHRLLCFMLTPLALFSIYYSPEIVTVFFKRGCFTLQDVQQVSAFLRPLLGVMLLLVPTLMQNNAVAALRQVKPFMPYALTSMLLFTCCVPATMYFYGPYAYPYTLLACTGIGLAVNAFFFKYKNSFLSLGQSYKDMIRLLVLNGIALIPSALYAQYGAGAHVWLTLGVGGLIFLATLTALYYYSKDLAWFLKLFRKPQPLP